MSHMISIYANLIQKGKKTIKEVPKELEAQVKKALKDEEAKK